MNRSHPPQRPAKLPVDPSRIRSMPAQFAPLDRRLVYDGHIRCLTHEQLALYVFLQCVSDAAGLSYYSDERLCDALHLSLAELRIARQGLVEGEFVLYRRPMYQALDLPQSLSGPSSATPAARSKQPPQRNESGEAVPIKTVLDRLAANGFSA